MENRSCPVSDSSSLQLEKTTCPLADTSLQPEKTTATPSNTEQVISDAKVVDTAPLKEEHVNVIPEVKSDEPAKLDLVVPEVKLDEPAKLGEVVKEVVDESPKVEGGTN